MSCRADDLDVLSGVDHVLVYISCAHLRGMLNVPKLIIDAPPISTPIFTHDCIPRLLPTQYIVIIPLYSVKGSYVLDSECFIASSSCAIPSRHTRSLYPIEHKILLLPSFPAALCSRALINFSHFKILHPKKLYIVFN